jgi:hypothetical protein
MRNPGTAHGFSSESRQKERTLEALGDTEMYAGTGRGAQGLIRICDTGILYL